jgi:CRP/FNR family cyclic AMP-dependent transcriptional regulator
MLDYPCTDPVEGRGFVLPHQVTDRNLTRDRGYRDSALRPSTATTITTRFATVPLFADCSRRELKLLCRMSVIEHRAKGATLVTQDEPGTEAYVILQGTCRVLRNGRRVGQVEPGGVVGELSMLNGAPRNATVVADEPLEVAILKRRDFLALLESSPSITRKLLERLAARVQELDARTCS